MTQQSDQLACKFQNLLAEWNKKDHKVDVCLEKVKKIHDLLISSPSSYIPKNENDASRPELLIAREVLEIACCLALEKKDIASFELYMAQLKPYYYDYKTSLPESPLQFEMLGLNLLCLLAQRRLSDFHTELERLDIDYITSNPYISHPVSMEQYLMEGNFHRVFLSKGNIPSKRYDFFINLLLNSTRDEVASCIESAYEKLSLKDAIHMLFFEDRESMSKYGASVIIKDLQTLQTKLMNLKSNKSSLMLSSLVQNADRSEMACESIDDKCKWAEEFWQTSHDLLVKSKLNYDTIDHIVARSRLVLRPIFADFVHLLHKSQIFFCIYSAGLGLVIDLFLQKHGLMGKNVKIISNTIKFDDADTIVGISEPPLHSLNKHTTNLKRLGIDGDLLQQSSVILIGDSLEDSAMLDDSACSCILRIGFLNHPENEEKRQAFTNRFDIVITNDDSFNIPLRVLNEVLK